MAEIKDASINDIITELKKRKRRANIKLVQKAYEFANINHEGQKRKSGEPYIIHPLNVAYILAEIGLDDSTISAALLHDVVEDTEGTLEELERELGTEIEDYDVALQNNNIPEKEKSTRKKSTKGTSKAKTKSSKKEKKAGKTTSKGKKKKQTKK